MVWELMKETTDRICTLADGLLKGDEAAVRALTEGLILSGITLSMVQTTRPGSGSEHHLSHFFEITGILDSVPYFPHGIDVAYSTVVTAKLREKLLSRPFPTAIYRPDAESYTKAMQRIYKSAADGCIALQKKVGNYTAERGYLQKEQQIREVLAQMPTGAEIEKMLSLAGLDMQDLYRLYGSEKIENAILYAKELKDRYTVLWLWYDLYGGTYV
jgi:glycerol-1-phosphate dehydrogenase [NAD(P)+]